MTRHGVIATTKLDVRQGPSYKTKVVDRVPAKEVLYVFGRSGNWLVVERPGGGTGFVPKRLVKLAAVA
jgi:hypothetical protein